ncbi:hypothetical protein M3Y97_00198300 [Aphelenchoides bicaudatus]|nr:hypothetical protein M3Y97_00198300 [Aphelenchoides bicaudatus]
MPKVTEQSAVDDGNEDDFKSRLAEYHEEQLELREEGKPNDLDEDYHEVEDGFKVTSWIWERLYNYQKTGVRWLLKLHNEYVGGILADEMGLGKTIQIAVFLRCIAESQQFSRIFDFSGLGPVLVVCPATLMAQWVRELNTWFPRCRAAIFHHTGSFTGSRKALLRAMKTPRKNGSVVITSYTTYTNYHEDFKKVNWHYVILDEGHKIRNPDAKTTMCLKELRTPHRLLLSGSPLQNNLKELWSLIDFVYPGRLGGLKEFSERFAIPITQGGYANANKLQVRIAYKCACLLRDAINPYMLQRFKRDVEMVLQLPNKSEQILFCDLTPLQRSLYIEYLESKEIKSILAGTADAFVGLINLRKLCNHPDLMTGGPNRHGNLDESDDSDDSGGSDRPENIDNEFGAPSRSGKLMVVESLLKLWFKQKQKVLLFSQGRQMLVILEKLIISHGYDYLIMDGSTAIGTRHNLVRRFNKDPDVFIFLLTTKVGGLGLNLTGANRVIIYDPDWNPATDAQARERAWRIGQNQQVTIYRLMTSGTIEEKIYQRQIFKQFLANRVLVDPKQKRFFKTNDLHELFTLGDATIDREHGTETASVFASKYAEINKETYREPKTLKDESKDQDEYVLKHLLENAGVNSALIHDKIVNESAESRADMQLIEEQADAVARRATEVLKRAHKRHQNFVQYACASSSKKSIFGQKKASFFANKEGDQEPPSNSVKKISLSPDYDDSLPTMLNGGMKKRKSNESAKESGSGALSSSQLTQSIKRQRNDQLEPIEACEERNEDLPPEIRNFPSLIPTQKKLDISLGDKYEKLAEDIRQFFISKDGTATTSEIVGKFKNRVPNQDSFVFRSILRKLAAQLPNSFWALKDEFNQMEYDDREPNVVDDSMEVDEGVVDSYDGVTTWQFSQLKADIISSVAFSDDGELLATGDRGGRIVIFARNNGWNASGNRSTDYNSHEPEFDYLKSLEIEEKINQIKWLKKKNQSNFILSTNDKTIKLWKISERERRVAEGNYNLSYVNGTAKRNASELVLPKLEKMDLVVEVSPRRVYSNAHTYHVNSISVCADQETFLSADDLRINLWHHEITSETFMIVDLKPNNMEELTEVITSAEFHPRSDYLFGYGSSKGLARICDTRTNAIADKPSITLDARDEMRGFFSEIVSSLSDISFSKSGKYLLTRDYLSCYVWDLANPSKPVETYQVHEYLKSKLANLYENDSIFDKFTVCWGKNDDNILTGSYHNYFHTFNRPNRAESIFEANIALYNNRRNMSEADHGNSTIGKRLRNDINVDNMNFDRKILNCAYHPSNDIIALAVSNNLFLYSGR